MKFLKLLFIAVLLSVSSNLYAVYEIDPATVSATASGFTTGLIKETNIGPGSGDPKIRIGCAFAKGGKFDPIVFPGQSNVGHHHTFFGNTGISPTSTASTLAGSGGSTCNGGAYIRSSFWIPSTLDSRTKEFIKPSGALIYYYSFSANQYTKKMPLGLKMLPGKTKFFAWDKPNFEYTCLDTNANGYGKGSSKSFPACTKVGRLRYQLNNFPECWNGVNLDSSDHRSHMAFILEGNGNNNANQCPSTHPVRLPTISVFVDYPVTSPSDVKYWRLASDSPSAPAGSALHADYFSGINSNVQEMYIQNCIRNKADCRMGLLGRGFNGLFGAGSDGKLWTLYSK
jgi:Domain of unknown function (DUF1996)